MDSHQSFGQAIGDQYPSKGTGGVEARKEVQNQDSLSPSSSSAAIQPVTENVVTQGGVTSGSAVTDQVEDLKKEFWEYYSNWINDAAKEVLFFSIW